jgi:hypothetical protein
MMLAEFTFDVELKPGEVLSLPKDATDIVGPGHWLISIRPADQTPQRGPIRDHSAFLKGFAPEDEGLYDDYSSR